MNKTFKDKHKSTDRPISKSKQKRLKQIQEAKAAEKAYLNSLLSNFTSNLTSGPQNSGELTAAAGKAKPSTDLAVSKASAEPATVALATATTANSAPGAELGAEPKPELTLAEQAELITAKKKKIRKVKIDPELYKLINQQREEKQQEAQERAKRGAVETNFEQFFLDQRILKALDLLKFNRPTDIQAKTLPHALSGRDILGKAETGTGKTLAFVIPALQHLYDFPQAGHQCRVIMVSPTRDLTMQIFEQVKALLGPKSNLRCDYILGKLADDSEVDPDEVFDKLENNDIVITTPGRLANEIKRYRMELPEVELLILDEADRILDQGMIQDLEIIAEACNNPERNTYLFTATADERTEELFAQIAQKDPIVVEASHSRSEKRPIQQYYYHCDDYEHKLNLLAHLIKDNAFQSTMVFVNKKERVSKVAKDLANKKMNIRTTYIDGDMSKEERERALGLFKTHKVQVIVTTDLLARGIDIPNVSAVFNFDMPYDGYSYIHRIGRTGRIGGKGVAISLVEGHEYEFLRKAMSFGLQLIQNKVFPGLEPQNNPPKDALMRKPRSKTNLSKSEKQAKLKKEHRAKIKAKEKAKKVKTKVAKNKGFPKRLLAK